MNIVIEPAKSDDAEAITDLLKETWLATYPNEAAGISFEDIRRRVEGEHGERTPERVATWQQRLSEQGARRQGFVAREENRIVGFICPKIDDDGHHRVGALYVLPKAQGRGIGSKLLKKAFEWHGDNDIYLAVAAYNEKAIGFYQKHGFDFTDAQIEDTGGGNGSKRIPEREMVRKSTSRFPV